VCKDFGMELNVKKTKTMAFSKTEKAHCNITVNGEKLEQVTPYINTLAAGSQKMENVT